MRHELRELLAFVLPSASATTSAALVDAGRINAFAAGEVVYHQAEQRPFAVIVAGHAALRRTTVNGRQLVPRLVGRGRVIGVSGIVGRVASNDVIALTTLRLALWPPDLVKAVAANDPGVGLDLLDHTVDMSRELWEQLDALVYQDARGRVARVLAAHRDLLFGDPAAISRAQLSGLVGTSREMTGRVLRSLESDGVLERVGRHSMRLLDRQQLELAAARA